MAKKRRNGEGTWGNKTISGIPYVFYRDAEGKYFYGKTEKAVKAKIKQANSASKMTASGEKKQTFGEYLLLWLQSIRTGIESTTYQSYLDAVNARVINYKAYDLANVRLAELSSKMFQDYLNSLAERFPEQYQKGLGADKDLYPVCGGKEGYRANVSAGNGNNTVRGERVNKKERNSGAVCRRCEAYL